MRSMCKPLFPIVSRRPIEERVVNALGKQWHVEVGFYSKSFFNVLTPFFDSFGFLKVSAIYLHIRSNNEAIMNSQYIVVFLGYGNANGGIMHCLVCILQIAFRNTY